MSPGDLAQALCGLDIPQDPDLLVGLGAADDAAVYRISADLALVQTVDFFTPVVDDPYDFGRIAAANALSDVYAMGGTPKTAMNMVAFPQATMALSILRSLLEGGLAQLRLAGVTLVGGHTIEDTELKYGLSVTGFIHPDRVCIKSALMPGDHLVLTKPLGTGIITTAIKAALAAPETISAVTRQMAELNRMAAMVMAGFPVHACTDITGFGLLGHLSEMVQGMDMGIEVQADAVPLLPQTREMAAMGLVPQGAHRNRQFREKMVILADHIDAVTRDILYDPQTSGGLLIALAENEATQLVRRLKDAGVAAAAMIGRVITQRPGKIHVI